MIDTIEDNENSPLEYLITGAVVLFFGGLYYYINHGSQYEPDSASLAFSGQNTPSISSAPSLFTGAAGLAVAANRPDSGDMGNASSDKQQVQAVSDHSDESQSSIADAAAQNIPTTEAPESAAKLQAEEELAALEAKKSKLESDVAKLEADKQKLLDTNTTLAAQADASIEKIEQAEQTASVPAPNNGADAQQTDSSQANSPDGKVYLLPDGRKVDIADKGFEGLLKQALNEKVVDTPIIFDGIYFESGAAEPNQQSQDQILATTALINTHKDVNILIKGHSDDTGDTKTNTVLSLTRSNYMKNALVELGIDARRIKVEGVGSLEPIAPNNTPEGRNSNRRIELILLN